RGRRREQQPQPPGRRRRRSARRRARGRDRAPMTRPISALVYLVNGGETDEHVLAAWRGG
ncbi:hypothetical protein HMPREF9057_00581, partial [Actinomyces sp. oral taxon 171 str. F0337]